MVITLVGLVVVQADHADRRLISLGVGCILVGPWWRERVAERLLGVSRARWCLPVRLRRSGPRFRARRCHPLRARCSAARSCPSPSVDVRRLVVGLVACGGEIGDKAAAYGRDGHTTRPSTDNWPALRAWRRRPRQAATPSHRGQPRQRRARRRASRRRSQRPLRRPCPHPKPRARPPANAEPRAAST